MSIKIETVKIDVNGTALELTLDDARNLHAALGELFKAPEIKWVNPHVITYPWIPTTPFIITSSSGETTSGLIK